MAEMDKKTDTFDLDGMFADMQAPDTRPAPDFMARVLQDALDVQTGFAPDAPPPEPRVSRLRQFLSAIGGWPAVAGLATAGVAGLWIGINPPNAVADTAENFLGTSSDLYLVDLMPGYDFTVTEG